MPVNKLNGSGPSRNCSRY